MTIDFCSLHDPLNQATWSGTNYFIRKMLEQSLGELNIITELGSLHTPELKLRYRWSQWIGRNFYYDHSNDFCRYYAAKIKERISGADSLVFCLSSQFLSYLDTPNKKVLYNDATLQGIYGYYDYFSKLGRYNRIEAFRNEKKALERADLLLYSSQWAADSALEKIGIAASKVKVVPFGANLEIVPARSAILNIIRNRQLEPLKLLFIGYDFDRKGGPLAVAVTKKLNEAGINTTLTLIGVKEFDQLQLPAFVVNGGVLDKTNPSDQETLDKHFKEAHIFLMPSQRECYGIVFVEAFAYGIPVLAVRTGGVPTVVSHDVNGWLFEPHEDVQAYVQLIMRWIQSPTKYNQASLAARQAYDKRLNWQAAGDAIANLVKALY